MTNLCDGGGRRLGEGRFLGTFFCVLFLLLRTQQIMDFQDATDKLALGHKQEKKKKTTKHCIRNFFIKGDKTKKRILVTHKNKTTFLSYAYFFLLHFQTTDCRKIIAFERLGRAIMHRLPSPKLPSTFKRHQNTTRLISFPPTLLIAMSDMAIEQKGLTTRFA